MNLTTIIQSLTTLDYDALRDVRDILEYDTLEAQMQATNDNQLRRILGHKQRLVKMRRRGRTGFESLHYPLDLQDTPSLSLPEQETLLATLNVLIDAKKPVAGHRKTGSGEATPIAQGTWQVKTKIMGKGSDKEYTARYLYLRVYVANLDGTKRTASIYIGSMNRNEPKPFIGAVASGDITKEQIISCFINQDYEGVKAWRQEMDELDEFGVSSKISDGIPGWIRIFIHRMS